MARLTYSFIASLDGYVEDAGGRFEWAAPGEEAHAFANELERGVGTHLLGRRMYETMAVWETDPELAAHSPITAEFAQLWQAAEKVVYSGTLTEATTRRTRIEPRFDPEQVRALKEGAERDLAIGGAELAGQALAAGLVDECQAFIAPAVVGSGKRALPDGLRLDLELTDQRHFGDGMAFLRYRVRG
jgi:dihydrofolate reductase